MNKVRIASAIASKHGVTLYLEDGKVLNLPSDSWKTKAILDEVLGPLARNKVVTIDLDSFSVEKAIEKKTNGVIRFFKRAVGALLGGSRESALSTTTSPVAVEAAAPAQEELVAVVKTKNGEREIPGVQKLARQMEHAAFNGNAKGLQKFMERIAKVIDQRGHTVQELLTFMERGDLPIADDGSIVAYKILQSSRDGYYVDCHTRKVKQKLGSRVSMNPKLVDPSRRTQCSAGLHVARRGYLRNFPGDVITLIKIGPEDVIAVPLHEPDKMRVAAYHIVANLPGEVHSILRNNQPMTVNATAAKILADVIAGNHVGVLEYVRIGEDGAEKITNREAKHQAPAPAPFKNGETKALDDAKTLTPKEIRSKAQAAKAEKPVKKAAPKKTPPAAPAKTGDRDSQIAKALALVAEGKLSMRAIERETGIPARTIGRVLKNK
ncbi:hypothetical protein [Mesorhizobium sp.]|uniref:hypothetical protein n=1 Tax=Mesorhizobium sp. TaxID=1871066 RepID=UPI000FE60AAD|nr:hypothetical protein [Mesorhizobium sp.]RWI35493.1 MAG: hypothetical protein EOR14_28740 [Mesorhizobium sp.]RWJ66338.1 MAG: hypothetical protein EOR34_28395 [Mesorhizobium sp.]